MSQITIYLPSSVAQKVRSDAKRAHKSVSAYIADLVRGPGDKRRAAAALIGSAPSFSPVSDDDLLPLDDIE